MRRNFTKLTALLLMLVMIAALSGCAEITGLNAQALMSPPKTTADRAALYALICGGRTDVTMVYPKNGEHRSAIISRDLNGDGFLEAISFCVNSEAGGIRLQFFSKDEDGNWFSLEHFTSSANQVDKVFFGDLNGDGQEEFVVGWGDPQTATASLSVYRMDGNTIQEFPMSMVTYREVLLTDFDGDQVQELFVLGNTAQTANEEETITALGSLYRFDGAQPYVSQTVPLDTAVIRYASVAFTKVNSWQQAAVLDGVKADGRMVTQIIGYDEVSEMLVSYLFNGTSEETNPTDRATAVAVTSRDINGDGIIEIPTTERLIEPKEGSADSTGYLIKWNTYSMADGQFTPVCESIANIAENYLVLLPDVDNIACINDSVTRTATFFSYSEIGNGTTFINRNDLFSITVYSEEIWKARQEEENKYLNDILLSNMAGRVYVLHILDDDITPDSALIGSVSSGFRILNE